MTRLLWMSHRSKYCFLCLSSKTDSLAKGDSKRPNTPYYTSEKGGEPGKVVAASSAYIFATFNNKAKTQIKRCSWQKLCRMRRTGRQAIGRWCKSEAGRWEGLHGQECGRICKNGLGGSCWEKKQAGCQEISYHINFNTPQKVTLSHYVYSGCLKFSEERNLHLSSTTTTITTKKSVYNLPLLAYWSIPKATMKLLTLSLA